MSKIKICTGSFLEKSTKNDGKCYNTTLMFDRNGELKAKYRKIHLFDVDVENVVSFKESNMVDSGLISFDQYFNYHHVFFLFILTR